MRYVLVGLVVASSVGGASADPAPESHKPWERQNTAGLFFELGGGWARLHPANGLTYRSEYLRIAPGLSLNRFVYLGAAFELGRIYSAYGTKDGAIATIASNTFTDEGNGSTLAGQVFVGVRDLIGIISVGGELAPTVRETNAGINFDYATDKTHVTTIEIHGRADVWATPYISAGVMVGMDIASIRDFQAGLQVAFHLEPYDAMMRNR
jgi:hypothetical protein